MGIRRVIIALIMALGIAVFPQQVLADHDVTKQVEVPASDLVSAINSLSRQTRVSIGGTQARMRDIRTRRLQGVMNAETALRRLLDGTPYTYRRISGHAFRIVRRERSVSQAQQTRPRGSNSRRTRARSTTPIQMVTGPPIIVTASKRDAELQTFPGTVNVIDLDEVSPARLGGGVEDIAASLPSFTSTHLGPGRNKVFIRGFADSSFNGPTQSTTAIYLDDYRLVYSAPDPDLRAFDLRRIEMLEGPQGTLYGAGSIGGILRIEQNTPELGDVSATMTSEISTVQGGGRGGTIAGSFNLPVNRTSAIRLTAYHQNLPGYIDDTLRGLTNVNQSTITGWRASFDTRISDDWSIRLDALSQDIDTGDGQYANSGTYERRSAVAQPFRSDVALIGARVAREWADVSLVSATNWTESELETRFDFGALSQFGEPQIFDEIRSVELLNHETRLSGANSQFSWVGGISGVVNQDRRIQFTGTQAERNLLERLDTRTIELAGFGEIRKELSDRIDLTVGLRLVNSWIEIGAEKDDGGEIEPHRQQFGFLPTVALGYRLSDDWFAYGKYQEGFRPGGASIRGEDFEAVEVENFDTDEVSYFEAGIRGSLPDLGISAVSFSISYADWQNIQSDTIDEGGFLATTNVGNGEIYSINVSANTEPWEGFELEGRAFFTRTDAAAFSLDEMLDGGEFPNIPDLGFAIIAQQILFERENQLLRIGGDFNFLGESELSVQPDLARDQGDFSFANAWLEYRRQNVRAALRVRNLFNQNGNRFSFGNPFTAQKEQQSTPLQPRTFSLSISHEF